MDCTHSPSPLSNRSAEVEVRGLILGVFAYTLWGVFPVYWKSLQHIPADTILCHRLVWSAVMTYLLATSNGTIRVVAQEFRRWDSLRWIALSSLLLLVNWFVYVWAINTGQLLEASLGYFITPLLNVALGILFLGERLRKWQMVALLLALLGVTIRTVSLGVLPLLAIQLGLSFAIYGLIRKRSTLASVEGLLAETALLSPFALCWLFLAPQSDAGLQPGWGIGDLLLLIGCGPISALPLIFFAGAARRLSMVTLGILQYLSPTLNFVLATLVYGEPVSSGQLVSFLFIWGALVLYTIDLVHTKRGEERVSNPRRQSESGITTNAESTIGYAGKK